MVHRPEEIGRHERRGPRGKRREGRNKPQADAGRLGEGRKPGNQPEGHPETQGVSPADEGGPKACQRVYFNDGARAQAGTLDRSRPESWPEGRQETRVELPGRKAAGGLSGSEGRKP